MTAAAYQNMILVMNVMTVPAYQMVIAGQVTVAVFQLITQVMTVMIVPVLQMVIAG